MTRKLHGKGWNPGGRKGKLKSELHRDLNKPIPKARLEQATHSRNPEIRRDAIRAETMAKWHHGGREKSRSRSRGR